jgi:hypothetical protein
MEVMESSHKLTFLALFRLHPSSGIPFPNPSLSLIPCLIYHSPSFPSHPPPITQFHIPPFTYPFSSYCHFFSPSIILSSPFLLPSPFPSYFPTLFLIFISPCAPSFPLLLPYPVPFCFSILTFPAILFFPSWFSTLSFPAILSFPPHFLYPFFFFIIIFHSSPFSPFVLSSCGTLLCRWFRFAQLAKGKKSRP